MRRVAGIPLGTDLRNSPSARSAMFCERRSALWHLGVLGELVPIEELREAAPIVASRQAERSVPHRLVRFCGAARWDAVKFGAERAVQACVRLCGPTGGRAGRWSYLDVA